MSHTCVETIDAQQFGMLGVGAVYLLRGKRCVLIDTGTGTTVHRWINRLRDVDLCAVLLTHVHPDHAGGLGAVLETHPESTAYVSSHGARHLVDPSFLNRSVRNETGSLAFWYGEVEPVPEHRLHVIDGHVDLELAEDITLEVIETPGHAPHHLCYLDRARDAIFCGDAVGLRRLGEVLTATSPPSFDLESSLRDLQNMIKLNPSALWLSHFGRAGDAVEVLMSYGSELEAWIERIRGLVRKLGSDSRVIDAIILAKGAWVWPNPLKEELAMFIRGAIRYVRASM